VTISDIARAVQGLLQGEPLRVISYGAIAVAWLVAQAAVALGYMDKAPGFDAIAVGVTVAVGALTELARRLVYSPATVAQILEEMPAGAELQTAAAVLEGSPPAVQPEDLPGGDST